MNRKEISKTIQNENNGITITHSHKLFALLLLAAVIVIGKIIIMLLPVPLLSEISTNADNTKMGYLVRWREASKKLHIFLKS